MRKYFLLAAGIVLTAILAASCSQESLVETSSSNEALVSLNVTLPGSPATRVYSDGYSAKNLYYAVYEKENSNLATQGTTTFPEGELTTTVNVTLLKGVTYELAFWAQADGAPYTFSAENQTVTVDYSSATCNDETRDAFYAVQEYTPENSTGSLSVELFRPLAQINFLSSDFGTDVAKDYVANMQSSIAITGDAYTTLNLLTGNASNPATVTFAATAIPTAEVYGVVPVEGYDYVAMAYVLVGAEPNDDQEYKDTFTAVSVNATSTNSVGNPMDIEVSVDNVPVQRNYRTNIYGALLTEQTVVSVEIKPAYEGSYPISYPVTLSVDGDNLTVDEETGVASVEVEATADSYSFNVSVAEGTEWTATADNADATLSIASTTALTKADDEAATEEETETTEETTYPSISGTGPATIIVSFPANTATEAVTTNVSVVADGAEALTVAITQAAAEEEETITIAKDTEAKTITITDSSVSASESSVTYAFADGGFENGTETGTITLDDGTTISFAQNSGSNPAKYYTSGAAVRIYALNSMTITGSSAIAEIVLTCTGSSYMGNTDLYATVDGNAWTVVNDNSSDSGNTQLRVVSITITYAGEAGEGEEGGDTGEVVETPSLSVSETAIEVEAAEGSVTFDVTSNVAWVVASDNTDFTVDPASGTGEEDAAVTVTVTYTANTSTESARTATITVSSEAEVDAQTVTITQAAAESTGGEEEPAAGDGTLENPYSVAEALAIINEGSYTSDNVYVAGTISKIDDISLSYGNATYYISDDGTTTSQLEIYRGYSLGGEKFIYDDEIAVGDAVVVCGVLTLYSSTPEITTGSSIVTLNGSSELTGDHLTLSETTLSASSGDAGSVTFDITSNTSWTVASDNTDFTVDPASGSGNATVTVSYTANDDASSRTATITVSYGSSTKTATITQISSSAKIITWENVGSSYQTWESATHDTYGSGYTATSDGLTASYYQYESSTTPVNTQTSQIRVYKSSELVISLADSATITSVVLYTTGGSSYCSDMTVSDGTTATADTSAYTISWSGSTTSFEAQAVNSQIRISKIVVTYE